MLSRWLSLASVMVAVVFVGCAGEAPEAKKQRIVILTNGDHPFWNACEAGAKEAEKELGLADDNLELSFERADFTVKGQVDKLRQYSLATDIVALGISVYDNTNPAIAEELKKLKESGIKIVTIDGEIDRDKYRDVRFAYLGTDNIVAGEELGKATAAVRPEGGKYAVFVGNKGNANAKARIEGFRNGVSEAFDEVTVLNDGGKPAVAAKMVQDALDRDGDITTLVGIWAYNGPAAVQIAEQRDLLDELTIVTFDAAEASVKAMEEGKLEVMVVQNPFNMGYQGVKLLKALVEDDQKVIDEMYPNYDEEDGDIYDTGLKLVVPSKDSPVKKDMLRPDTEFLTLPEFKAWLKKYNLKDS